MGLTKREELTYIGIFLDRHGELVHLKDAQLTSNNMSPEYPIKGGTGPAHHILISKST